MATYRDIQVAKRHRMEGSGAVGDLGIGGIFGFLRGGVWLFLVVGFGNLWYFGHLGRLRGNWWICFVVKTEVRCTMRGKMAVKVDEGWVDNDFEFWSWRGFVLWGLEGID